MRTEGELIDKYQIGERLGRGAFASVHKGLNIQTGEFVAIKQIDLEGGGVTDEQLLATVTELELLKTLHHENVVSIIGFKKTGATLNFILELIENGSLEHVIKKFGVLPESLVRIYVHQLLRGLAYLHKRGVVHRDIKAANLLVTKDGTVKLTDFGIASKLSSKIDDTQQIQGSPFWLAPEVISVEGASTSSDIWSLGCTVIELFTGAPPFFELDAMQAMFRIVEGDEPPPFPDSISDECRDFLARCFSEEMQVLTSRGFLFLHEIEAYDGDDLRFAGYDRERALLVYERATAFIVNAARPDQRLVELTHAAERRRWGVGSDAYGRVEPSLAAHASRRRVGLGLSVVVTHEHDLFVRHGRVLAASPPSPSSASSPSSSVVVCSPLNLASPPVASPASAVTRARIAWDFCPSGTRHVDFAKIEARTLLSSPCDEHDRLEFLCCARNGVAEDSAAAAGASGVFETAAAAAAAAAQQLGLVRLVGFFLGAGTLRVDPTTTRTVVCVQTSRLCDVEWLETALAESQPARTSSPPLVCTRRSAVGGGAVAYDVCVDDGRLVALVAHTLGSCDARGDAHGDICNAGAEVVAAADGRPAKKLRPAASDTSETGRARSVGGDATRVEAMPSWVWRLAGSHARALLQGMQRARTDGHIVTCSPRLRDDVVRLALHAGLSPRFERANAATVAWIVDVGAGERGVANERDDGANVNAYGADGDDDDDDDEQDEAVASRPVLRQQRDVGEVALCAGRTWCLTVPSGLLIARRAFADATTGDVLKASVPVVIGNCFQKNPLKRPSARALLQHKWVAELEDKYPKEEPLVSARGNPTPRNPLATPAGAAALSAVSAPATIALSSLSGLPSPASTASASAAASPSSSSSSLPAAAAGGGTASGGAPSGSMNMLTIGDLDGKISSFLSGNEAGSPPRPPDFSAYDRPTLLKLLKALETRVSAAAAKEANFKKMAEQLQDLLGKASRARELQHGALERLQKERAAVKLAIKEKRGGSSRTPLAGGADDEE